MECSSSCFNIKEVKHLPVKDWPMSQPCGYKKVLIYHPSNSKKGIAIKGTNQRVELVWVESF